MDPAGLLLGDNATGANLGPGEPGCWPSPGHGRRRAGSVGRMTIRSGYDDDLRLAQTPIFYSTTNVNGDAGLEDLWSPGAGLPAAQ